MTEECSVGDVFLGGGVKFLPAFNMRVKLISSFYYNVSFGYFINIARLLISVKFIL